MANTDRAISALEKQKTALKLRAAGVEYTDIAHQLGYKTASGAHKAVTTALRKTLQEPADELRTLELNRLDVMLKSIWSMVIVGNPQYIVIALKILERRARLLGLDAPTKQDITSKGEQVNVVLYLPDNGRHDDNQDN